jgi:hypothetical protein
MTIAALAGIENLAPAVHVQSTVGGAVDARPAVAKGRTVR